MPIKVKMIPHVQDLSGESGINTVVRKWFQHLPDYDIELVDKDSTIFDVVAIHAGMSDRKYGGNVVSHCHGLYWSNDYNAQPWEWAANRQVISTISRSKLVTVPSSWVAEPFQRDMRINPFVVPHGVDMQDWLAPSKKGKYVIGYLKNRSYVDVCNPQFLTDLAARFPNIEFLSTFPVPGNPANVRVTGIIDHNEIPKLLRDALCVISPIKETFGLLTLETMASGIPVLGYNHGGNVDLISHMNTGYLAQVNSTDDMEAGLNFCMENRAMLGKNARAVAKEYTWAKVCKQLAGIYELANHPEPATIAVVIPSYNYGEKVGRAIESVLAQEVAVNEIVVVDDGSPDNGLTESVVKQYSESFPQVRYIRQDNGGVAVARNNGIDNATSKYIICLDADDALAPLFTRACVEALEADPTLGIAYTRLLTKRDDGSEGISQWPGEWNFDQMLERKNQVPTACMFRREMWRRLGGYRQRYAPNGAGAEDAEFWLRSGAYGFKAKLVTEAPLFIYSFLTGNVSGNRKYREVDWTSLHPWCKDGQHPFASYATPANLRLSHPVREYDEPVVSVIIPVGNGHKKTIFNALDSLEAQSFRKWEAIVIDDTTDGEPWSFDGVTNMLDAYPYIKLISTGGGKGAGYARNRGVDAARGNLILFLDADDNLLSQSTLQMMLDAWNATGQIVYTDYIGKSYIEPKEADRINNIGRLVEYNPKTNLAMTRSNALDYDCERAIAQPANPLYIWNLITSLFPKQWHYEIGGFDETMPSWEDWLYWLMMARAGKCFTRIAEPLVVYRFYTGSRRETGIQIAQELLQYIADKLSGVKPMACGCSKNKKNLTGLGGATGATSTAAQSMMTAGIADDDVVLVRYMNPNTGQHRVVGVATGRDYGYRSGGGTDIFYVLKADQVARRDWFIPVNQ